MQRLSCLPVANRDDKRLDAKLRRHTKPGSGPGREAGRVPACLPGIRTPLFHTPAQMMLERSIYEGVSDERLVSSFSGWISRMRSSACRLS